MKFISPFFCPFFIFKNIKLYTTVDFKHRQWYIISRSAFTKSLFTLFIASLLAKAGLGQPNESAVVKAYKANSYKNLQDFLNTWVKETSFEIQTGEILFNDTLNNVYGLLNSFYESMSTQTKCILMQEKLQYNIVDCFNRDTLIKRAIYRIYKSNPDSVYKKAISKPGSFDYWLEEDIFYVNLKSGSIKICPQYLIIKDKKILPLTARYTSILSNYLLDNSEENRPERTKRLIFLKDEIAFWEGNYGYIRIEGAGLSLTMDSAYENAVISYRGNTSGGQSALKKINNKWTIIESHRTWIE